MVRNVRWLYNKLGTEDFSAIGDSVTGALSSLQSELDGKSPSSHNHGTSSLPVSSNQVNSENYIPASAILYSMAQRVEGIQALIASAKRELDDPNKRYESKSLGTWSSVSDVDTFLSQYTHENNYEGLSLGNYVTLPGYFENEDWVIAGFDMESGQLAADGTVYDNGYGICMIPRTTIEDNSYTWSDNTLIGGYLKSKMHTYQLPNVIDRLKDIIGSHIVNRNVLLSSKVGDYWGNTPYSINYTWATSDATLMSIGQMTGTFAQHTSKYDDGEANYKLPLFNYENYYVDTYSLWTRNIKSTTENSNYVFIINKSSASNRIGYTTVRTDMNMRKRPLIYIR